LKALIERYYWLLADISYIATDAGFLYLAR
jgi:hypothetical protein